MVSGRRGWAWVRLPPPPLGWGAGGFVFWKRLKNFGELSSSGADRTQAGLRGPVGWEAVPSSEAETRSPPRLPPATCAPAAACLPGGTCLYPGPGRNLCGADEEGNVVAQPGRGL